MHSIVSTALPRAGLLGNPSDLYGGRGIGFTFEDFSAEVELRPSNLPDRGDIIGIETGGLLFSSIARSPEVPILQATREILPELGVTEAQQGEFLLSLRCDIPQLLGLSGSSAIIVAALRAICSGLSIPVEDARVAELALRVETEIMGIAAGPMDRMIQSYGGLIAMDFESGEVEPLDSGLLPPIAILMDGNPGEDSGLVHAPVRERWEAGDPEVRAVMAEFRPLVERGLAALKAGDTATLIECVNRNFDLRAQVFPIAQRDRKIIEIARLFGAGSKFCGSGGAILAVHEDPGVLDELCLRVIGEGFQGIRPQITGRNA
jgi:glucuronokinase